MNFCPSEIVALGLGLDLRRDPLASWHFLEMNNTGERALSGHSDVRRETKPVWSVSITRQILNPQKNSSKRFSYYRYVTACFIVVHEAE